MTTSEIEEFAEILVKHVRDVAIQSCDQTLHFNTDSPVTKHSKMATPDERKKLAHEMIPRCVDDTIFYLLTAIDQGLLQLTFLSSSGKKVDITKEGRGELGGWYMTSDGWRAKYSSERFVDDLSDLV